MTFARSARGPRRGAVAIQFAMLTFAFFGIAAVLIDMRLAVHAQQLMQHAADSAALEGLGRREATVPPNMRQAASDRVQVCFDDDLDPSNGDPMNFGAGPVIDLVNGIGPDNSSAQLVVGTPPVLDVVPELNTGNAVHGDIVTGTFDPLATTHVENSDYTRSDFTPAAAPPGRGAMLVRMRRTPDRFGLDQIPGVSSSGPPLPFLFGFGSTMHGDGVSGYDPRTDGVTVRATSIADARRAVQISGPGPNSGFARLQRFVLFSSATPGVGHPFVPPGNQFPSFGGAATVQTAPAHLYPAPGSQVTPILPVGAATFAGPWDDWSVGTIVTIEVDANGYFRLVTSGVPGAIIGFRSRRIGTQDSRVYRVGQIADALPTSPIAIGEHYVPIVRSVDGYLRAIGFGRVGVLQESVSPLRYRIRKLIGGIWGSDASAVDPAGIEALAAVPGLRPAHAAFTNASCAPVLVR